MTGHIARLLDDVTLSVYPVNEQTRGWPSPSELTSFASALLGCPVAGVEELDAEGNEYDAETLYRIEAQ